MPRRFPQHPLPNMARVCFPTLLVLLLPLMADAQPAERTSSLSVEQIMQEPETSHRTVTR